MILDDDKDFAELLAVRFRSIGMETRTALNPFTALALVEEQTPDLICLDVDMTTGNGLTVREFLASDPVSKHTPVVIVTGRNDDNTIRRCGELNAKYVHKSPKLWQDLQPLVSDLLHRSATC